MGTWFVLDKYGRAKTTASTIPAPLEFVGNGGLELGGGGLYQFPILHVGDGGIELGGGAVLTFPVMITGNGGLELGGAADLQFPFTLVSDGGLELGGGGEYFQPIYVIGNGGLELGGGAQRGEPIHHWKFDENTGSTAADIGVGTQVAATSIGAWTTTDLLALPGGNAAAARLSHTDTSLTLPLDIVPDVAGDFTIVGLVRINTAVENWDFVYPIIGVSGNGVVIGADTSNGSVLSGGWMGSIIDGVTQVPFEEFFQFALRRTAATNLVEVLLNAVVDGSGTATGNPNTLANYQALLQTSNTLTVDFDDFRVYNRLVDDAELLALMTPPYFHYDTFTDTNGTSMDSHTPDIGTGYTSNDPGKFTVQGNKALVSAAAWVYEIFEVGETDGYIEATIDLPGSANYCVILGGRSAGGSDVTWTFRLATDGFGFGFGPIGDPGQASGSPPAVGSTVTLRVEFEGTEARGYINGVLRATRTMGSGLSNTKWVFGEYGGYNHCTWDNLKVGVLP